MFNTDPQPIIEGPEKDINIGPKYFTKTLFSGGNRFWTQLFMFSGQMLFHLDNKDIIIKIKEEQTEGAGQFLLPDRSQIWDGYTQN